MDQLFIRIKKLTFFLSGDLFEVTESGFVNLSEEVRTRTLTQKSKPILDAVDQNSLINYPGEGESKGYVMVFTDVNCPYCRKFHNEIMPSINAMGVDVRYFAYPVIGREKSHKQMTSAWCSEDPAFALTELKGRREIPDSACETAPH